MDSDKRFEHLASDPRFKTLRKKQKKVQIDDRFKSMFTDEKFTLKYTKDKRGKSQKKTSGDDLKRYYEINENDKDDDDDLGQKVESESELSSSSDESESESESIVPDTVSLDYDWQPLDHDAEITEISTKRLAIQNLDWDHLDVRDIYTLIHSVRPPLCVKIYVSEFGKNRLEREAMEGPQEIVDMPKVDEEEEEYSQLREKMLALKNHELKSHRINEYEDADQGMDPKNEEMRERIRRYQLNRMKYYYAIVEFDSIESSELVYKELDGREYQGSSLELDLRFVPDDVEFEEENVKAKCDRLPDLTSYQAPQFINSALQQTTVKFTWDETDTKRRDKLLKAYTKEELDKDDLEAYLASETDSEEEDEEFDESRGGDAISIITANSEARANKYKTLLQSLEEEEQRKKKVDVNIEWGTYEEAEKMQTESDSEGESAEDADGDGDGLDLLVMGEHSENFQFDPDDERFKAIYESPLYNIDPSHPNFKRTKALELLAEKKREKRERI